MRIGADFGKCAATTTTPIRGKRNAIRSKRTPTELAAAHRFLDECLRNGITTASVYSTVHPTSVDAFCTAAQQRGFCMAAGKVMMDRNAPDDLRDTAQSGYEQSKALIARWHGVDRLTYVVTPRFAVTSSPAQLSRAA